MPAGIVVHVADGLDLRRIAPGMGGRHGVTHVVRRAARAALEETDAPAAKLSFAILADAEMAELHGRYLGKPVTTDVLSFPLNEQGAKPSGEVCIGIEQAARQAEELHVPLDQELARLAIHGTLHILGHDHPEDEGRVTSPMWQLQEHILWQLNTV
ncbi:MAG: rRNA maturation RNase YbeY [Longimicrobiales bacterium]